MKKIELTVTEYTHKPDEYGQDETVMVVPIGISAVLKSKTVATS